MSQVTRRYYVKVTQGRKYPRVLVRQFCSPPMIQESPFYATINQGELRGICMVLQELIRNKPSKAVIYSSSRYAIGSATQDWNAKKNKKLVEEVRWLLSVASKNTDVSIEYLPAKKLRKALQRS